VALIFLSGHYIPLLSFTPLLQPPVKDIVMYTKLELDPWSSNHSLRLLGNSSSAVLSGGPPEDQGNFHSNTKILFAFFILKYSISGSSMKCSGITPEVAPGMCA
jgi:hypothetical protein